ncbi:MAG: SusC/RagA family TonB-linked outer membrane protein, partial [Chitinophagaceae bacterium]|nr:SusC/RagA family TonB-linked outer membrane protein [Chitinophagaceae bacterium]
LMISNSLKRAPYEQSSPFTDNFEVGNPWYDIWNNLPIIPVQDPTLVSSNNPGGWGIGSANARTFSRNPVAIANITSNNTNFFKVLGNAFVDLKVANWLSYRFNAGLETSFDRAKYFRRESNAVWYWNQSPKPSEVGENRSQFLTYLFEHTLNFNKSFGRHSFNGVVGYTDQTIRRDIVEARRTDLSQFGGTVYTTIVSAQGVASGTGRNSQYLIQSVLGRLNYNLDDRYLATFTFRSDKDSRFSPEYRTGFFPSGALAWRISKENFFNIPWVSDLKIRGSYGVLGNANLEPYQYTGYINQAPRAVFGPDQEEFRGATQGRLAYVELRWEKKSTANIGVDAALLDNRLLVALEVFRSKSEDVLVPLPLAGYLGNLQGDPLVNIGEIENKGIEVELTYRSRKGGNFLWDVSANFAIIRNKVLALGNLGVDDATGQPKNYLQSGNTRSQVGRAIGEYFVLRTDGIFQNTKEIEDHAVQRRFAKPGDIRYLNVVNSGTDDDINDLDRQFAGSPWPKLTTGLQFNSSYKRLTLSLQLYGAFGQKLYNDVRRDLDAQAYSNYRRDISPWTPQNTNTSFPRAGVSYRLEGSTDPNVDQGIVSNVRANTDRWVEDGSFLRVRNLEIGFMLPESFINRIHLTDARLFVSGQNLVTFTKYSGLDPDVVGANVNLEPGVDNGNYPSSRIITLGINFGL